MTTLVVGGTGNTGKLLVAELRKREEPVKVIVRSPEKLPEEVQNDAGVEVITGTLLDLSDDELTESVRGCSAVASCLGHTLSFKGVFGKPRRLVTEATRRLCRAIKTAQPEATTKFVLMNTTGNRNRDLNERVSIPEHCVLGLLRLLVPPHPDNEQAAEVLRTEIGQQDEQISWVIVRPDSLIDLETVSQYELHPSPVRSAIFNSGKTSRINVGHFMAELMTNEELWNQWRGQMPVIYNSETATSAAT